MRLHLFASILDVIMTSIGMMKYRKKCRNGRETRYYINFELLNIEILKGPVESSIPLSCYNLEINNRKLYYSLYSGAKSVFR